jgi:two-component system, cell cycle sensor histidine kinase and response regulator CckA
LPVPFWEHRGIKQPVAGFLPGTVPRHISFMTANPIPWPGSPASGPSGQECVASKFHSFFGNAPIGVACCNREGLIVAMNAAFKHRLAGLTTPACLRDMVRREEGDEADFLLRELIECRRDTIQLAVRGAEGQETANWIAWRQTGIGGESEFIVIAAEAGCLGDTWADRLFQAQRWEAIGRLTGGVVHDFNNLLTGVMLYCDLLLSGLDQRDLRRRYAEEIRAAIVPASGLVGQLLGFARGQHDPSYPVSFNEIAEGMRDLLVRLLGDNISLELHLDSRLDAVKIARCQAQQVLLNLVLNARDAMPEGGCISIETSNGRFQPIAGGTSKIANASIPCVLLTVSDNGHGMDRETRRRLFEPFFTTKAGKAGGLGLTTVQSIVTSHRGLIHFQSEPCIGTRAMTLWPRADGWDDSGQPEARRTSFQTTSATPLQGVTKELLS